MISRRTLFGFALAPVAIKLAAVDGSIPPSKSFAEFYANWGNDWRKYADEFNGFMEYCPNEELINRLCSRVWDNFLVKTLSVRHQKDIA